jgi:hypothetical protein
MLSLTKYNNFKFGHRKSLPRTMNIYCFNFYALIITVKCTFRLVSKYLKMLYRYHQIHICYALYITGNCVIHVLIHNVPICTYFLKATNIFLFNHLLIKIHATIWQLIFLLVIISHKFRESFWNCSCPIVEVSTFRVHWLYRCVDSRAWLFYIRHMKNEQ